MDPHATRELIQAAAAAAAAARLLYLNLANRFPALITYLMFLAAMDVGLGLQDRASAGYFFSYVALESGKYILIIIAVRELFALTFDNYPGIRTAGRWAMYAGIVLALVISLVAARYFWGGGPGRRSADLFYFEVSQRSVVFTLAVVVATLLLFLSKYPLHLGRNTLVSGVFFCVLFLSEALRLLIDSLAPKLSNPHTDWPSAVFVAVGMLAWAGMLHRTEPAPARVLFSSPREEHLLRQLAALNQIMAHAIRR